MEQFPARPIDSNKIFRRLNGYWNGLWRLTNGKPSTSSFELSNLGPILPYLAVTQYDQSTNRLTFSYVGATLRDRFGPGVETGFIDESTSEEIRGDLQNHLHSVVQTGQPIVMAADMKNPNVPFRHYECFSLPVAGTGQSVTALISAITYAPCKHATRKAA